jgi:hypothetical protein
MWFIINKTTREIMPCSVCLTGTEDDAMATAEFCNRKANGNLYQAVWISDQ